MRGNGRSGRSKYSIAFALVLTSLVTLKCGLAQNSYTWKSVIAGGGGFVPGIIYHPTSRGLVYARTDIGGAYRWEETANRWIPLTDMMDRNNYAYMGILSIALDPKDANRIYMETGEYTQWWAGNGAVLSSTDKGNTWKINPLSFKIGGNEDGRGCGERLQVDPNQDSILFMGTSSSALTSPAQGGLWKSTNCGASWSGVSSFSPANVNFVVFDPASSASGVPTKKIFVAAADTSGKSLYESTDGGNSWQVVPGQPHGMMAIRGVVAGGLLYMTFSNSQGPMNATAGTVWKYNIGGGVWTNITPAPAPPAQGGYSGLSVYPGNPNYLIVSTLDCWYPKDEVYVSTNGGSSWTGKLRNATLNHSYAPYTSTVTPHWLASVAMDPFDSSKAMFGTGYGIWACDNIFAATPTWYFKDQNLEETAPFQLISPGFTNLLSVIGDYDGFRHDNLDVSPPQGRWNPLKGTTYSIAYAGKVPSKIVKAYSSSNNWGSNNQPPFGAYSTDGGTTWNDFAGYPAGTIFGGRGGQLSICISADGGTILWSPVGGHTSYSIDDGKSWTACGGVPDSVQPKADPVNPKKFYVFDACGTGKIFCSTDGGKTFAAGASRLPLVPGYQSQDGMMTTVPGREGDLWMCTGSGGLYHSTNSGSSASKVNSVGTAWLCGTGKPSTAGGYPALYLWGIVNGTLGIFRSDNSGSTWTRINDDSHQFGLLAYIEGDPRVYGRCYIGAGGRGMLYGEPENSDTTDNPSTFTFSSGTGESLQYLNQKIAAGWSKAADPLGKQLTYVMHFFGPGVDTTFTSTDSTGTFSAGNIQSLSRYVLTGYVTNGFDTTASANAVWYNSASSIATELIHSPDRPSRFALEQNYPNPFNPTTTISYQLSANCYVSLRVYDVLGRKVKTLVNEVKKMGSYEARFDGGGLPSGVYFYRIVAGGFTQTRKLLLVK